MDFAEIQRNIEMVSNQSKSQKEMLERLREKIETLVDRNSLLECENTALQPVYEKICVREEDACENIVIGEEDAISHASSGTEDEK